MDEKLKRISILFLTALTFTATAHSQDSVALRIDPLLLVSLKECRNIAQAIGNQFFPGWDFQKTPVLFYRPNIQELLICYPHRPRGFSRYVGFNPLGNETIYVRNDTTFLTIDDQNTSMEVEGVTVLVVADTYSRMRNRLQGTIFNHSQEFVRRWLDQWNFVLSPYDAVETILHEAFHVYQNAMAPDKWADEMVVTQYPLLDPLNNALYVIEGSTLKDALLTPDRAARMEKIREFVAVRTFRQARLDSSFVEYENLNEYAEGLAKYVEYQFMKLGESVEPTSEMYYHEGFNGYRGVLSKMFQNAVENMVNVVAVSDDRFGNKFGSGPLRFKLYELGACQALLLDEVMPSWKDKIFGNSVFLTDLLKEAVPLSASESESYREMAKREYRYDQAYESKLQFQQDGKKLIDQKLSEILQTKQTLVKIFYGGYVDRVGLGGFTPFGVTQITKKSAIYDLVPIKVIFKEGVILQMKQVVPVLIDREKKMVAFAVQTAAAHMQVDAQRSLQTDEFILSGINATVKRQDNTVEVQLR